MSSSRPPSHYYSHSMNSQGSYERYQTPIDIPNTQDFQRRIWVKISNGNPTTILILADDLIDDLKSLIILKYPNSLGKTWDCADLIIKLDHNKGFEKKHSLSVSPDKAHGYNFMNNNNVNANNLNANNTNNNFNANTTISNLPPNKFITLESDQNIFSILDNYYPHGMSMYDALIIEHPLKEYDNIPCYQPKPQYNINPKLMKERSMSPGLINTKLERSISPSFHNPLLSPIIQSKPSPLTPGPNHRRSQSNPPQSPASQAVLLLPKNFSLTGTESKKNDDDKDDRFGMFLKRLPSLPKINTEDLSTNEPAEDSKPTKKPLGLQVLKSNQPLASPSRTPISPNHKDNKDTKDNKNSSILIQKSDSKSVKSTTEKVLPSISVLVVEDNAINQAILGAFLRKHKIHYQIAKNGQEAIDKWRTGGFHLILMDIQLPIKSGIEATKEIRHLEKINQIGVFDKSELINNHLYELTQDEKLDMNSFRSPVIIVALTASSNSSVDRQNALMAGCNDYLTKPVNLVWLQNKITEWGCMQALIDFDGWKVKSIAMGNKKESKDKDKVLGRKQIAT